MAVILEVIDPRGARTRRRLETFPLTLGRALANDLVLDDPYVDARHARIVLDDTGALMIEDLGSVNGLVANQGRCRGPMRVDAGAEVRLGRTVLRFRDPDEPVPPALLDDASGASPAPRGAPTLAPGRRPATGRRLITALAGAFATTPVRLAIVAVAAVAFGCYFWLGSSERSPGSEAVAGAMIFITLATVWAGPWAIGSRAIVHRFQFVGHLAVASTVALLGLAWSVLEEWLAFLFPDAGLVEALSGGTALALMVVLVAWHLSLSSTMSSRRQWRAGAIVGGILFALGGLAAVTEDDSFTDVPTFSAVLKPVGAGWVPTSTVDEFGEVMRELKHEVDEMTERK